jgi:hypothetical protein
VHQNKYVFLIYKLIIFTFYKFCSMRLKKLHLLLFGFSAAFCNVASAQLVIDQATFTIQSGATVTVQGDVTSNADILGTGKIILKGTANQNVNMGGKIIPNLEVDNTANVTLTGNAIVSGNLLFTNGKVLLGANTLNMGSAATVTGATSAKYIVTNGAGKLTKSALGSTAFSYPVGNSLTSYTPVSVTNSGTADDISVRVLTGALPNGTAGTAFTKEVVNASWDITEAVAGGSNLSLTTTWNGTDELSGFDRSRAGISYYITTPAANVGWDMLNSMTAAAAGANPYSYTRMGVTTLGTFAVGTRPVLSPLLVTPKIFLQGAYNTSLNVMDDFLRTSNLIPTTEPYTASSSITGALRGSGGGETTASSVVGSGAPGTNNAIVDWVLVQLHRTSDNVVISQRAVLLQKDGDVVDTDGVSPVNIAGNALGSYYISVKHRNHIGVRTTASIALAKVTNTNYDFSSALSQALIPATPATNAAMTNKYGNSITTPVYMLWGGNANGNTTVRYSGPANDEVQLLTTCLSGIKANTVSGYLNCDLNMNNTIKYSGPVNDEVFLLSTVLLGNKAATITQSNF